MKGINLKFILLMLAFVVTTINYAQQKKDLLTEIKGDTTVYHLNINKTKVNLAGKKVNAMSINGSIPGPTLKFKEGGFAVIYVRNNMDVETSVHWHGLLVPNYYDGVPYLTTPPIRPGHTEKYEFPLKQSGTYWYHGHTGLQEQIGVYGSIIIEPKEKKIAYDKDLVLVFSDWTNEKPSSVLKTLKRGSNWYNIKKGTSTPLNEVLKRRAFSAQLKFWKQRMESAGIADIYYPAFLVNGKPVQNYTDFKPGEKVRLRIINAGASTSFWLTFGGDTPTLVSADGKNIVPVKRNKTFIAIAETYDFIVTIPENGRIEIRATSQDGTGKTSAFLGTGKKLVALDVPKPDKIEMMKKIAKMDMKMGAPALVFNSRKSDPYKMMKKYGMKMSSSKNKKMAGMDMIMKRTSKNLFSKYNYDYLKSPNKTSFSKDIPVKNILLNLTGNMQRYVWSLNGKPLSEADKIKIKSGEVTRITLNNLTMMSHPMHLHGHFFRVINKNGDYSPLKHTVNVGPMQKVTIEFYGNESGDWFFHCHILYHLVGGMARVVSYGTPRDTRLKMYPVSKIIDETNRFYSWSNADIASHMIGFNFTTSNIRNQFNITTEYGWNKNLESEITYERYLQSYFRIFGGVNFENTSKDNLNNITTTAVIGMRYLTPYLFNLDVRIDSKLRPDISLSRSIMIFPRTVIFGYYEYKANFNWSNKLPSGINYQKDITWNSGLEYIISKNISVFGSYDNRFGAGGGFSFRF